MPSTFVPVLPIPKAAEVQNRNTYISSLSQGECSGVKNIPGARSHEDCDLYWWVCWSKTGGNKTGAPSNL